LLAPRTYAVELNWRCESATTQAHGFGYYTKSETKMKIIATLAVSALIVSSPAYAAGSLEMRVQARSKRKC
jgi:hypothetical protein